MLYILDDEADRSNLKDLSNSKSKNASLNKKKSHHKKTNQNHTPMSKKTWSENETIKLVLGVEVYGKGQWARIKVEYKAEFKDRTTVNMKDKYRNLERNEPLLKRYVALAKAEVKKLKNQQL